MVGSIDSGILATVKNTGAFGNATPGTDIAAGSGVQPADYLAAPFAVPAPNDHVQITLQGSNTWLSPNHIITIGGGAGIYMVESIDLNDEHKATVKNTGAFGNALPGGTDIAAGSDVQGELDSRAFDWTPPVDGDFSRPEIHFNEMLFVSLNNPIVGLVHIKRGHRCRFYNCEFIGLDPDTAYKDIGTTGVALWLENSGGTTVINSRNIYASGGLIKCSNGGELVMINCRCEGAKDVPAFDFQDVDSITLIGLATEGRRENPALFRFLNCSNVVVLNPGLARADVPYAMSKYTDGMQFEGCHEFTVIQPYTKGQGFSDLGDHSARAIRIMNDCRYGVLRGSYCLTHASDTDIEIANGAKDCYVEAFSDVRGGLVGRGTLVADSLRGSPGLPANTYFTSHEQGYDLEIGGGDGCKPGTDLAGNTVIQLGQPVPDASGNSASAQLAFKKGPANTDEFGSIRYQNDALRVGSAGDIGSSISFNATGLAFNDNSPITKPVVAGSSGGNSALQSLLKALHNLGLITNATTL